MKRTLLSLILALLICGTLLASCNKEDSEVSDYPTETDREADDSSEGNQQTEETNYSKSGIKISFIRTVFGSNGNKKNEQIFEYYENGNTKTESFIIYDENETPISQNTFNYDEEGNRIS